MLSYNLTPIQQLHASSLQEAEVKLFVKREELNHPFVTGNKWWKLKHNLAEAKRQGKTTLLTFGGAFSNHIYATAAASQELGFKSIGVIRGEESALLSKTLLFAKNRGMHLHFVSREDYLKKSEAQYIETLQSQFGDFYLIPEGGTNNLALMGVEEFAATLVLEVDFDYLCCSCGTGGTLAGLIRALPEKKVLGFSSLKGDFLVNDLKHLVGFNYTNWSVQTDYHFGGYAKHNVSLLNFIEKFETEFSIPIEQVYTAKMFFGLFDLIEKGFFKKGSTILALHTGGLQGRISELKLLTSNR